MGTTTEKIKQLLKSDFELKLFNSSLKNLNDKTNDLRYHNFCYSIRELSRHFLYNLSPNESVENCSWFKPVPDTSGPTRAQRIKFAIQGGISDKSLESLGFDLTTQNDIIKKITSIIKSLSKYTHINLDNFELSKEDIDSKSISVLETFTLLVKEINSYKDDLKQFLDGIIEENMIDRVISNSYQNIDILAPHFSLEHSEVNDYHIEEITDHEIILKVHGMIYVILEYGSRLERKNNDGLDLKESFPYETSIIYQIEDEFPNDNYEIEPFTVDTSSWYGDDDNLTDEEI